MEKTEIIKLISEMYKKIPMAQSYLDVFATGENKKFLETDYPRGRAIEVFRRFHFGLGGQKPKFYILPLPELRKGNSDLPQGEVLSETPRQSHRGIILN